MGASAETPAELPPEEVDGPPRRTLVKVGLGALSLAVVVATFAFLLPRIADYAEVWAVVRGLSWGWVAALAGVTAVALLCPALTWVVALPGLRVTQAAEVTQASTALGLVVPGGMAAGTATAFAMLHSSGFQARAIARAVTLTALWNQLFTFLFPVVAVFLLAVAGADTTLLAPFAFVGAGVVGVVATALVLVFVSDRLAGDVGDVAATAASWGLGRLRRGPVRWNGRTFERFRDDAQDLIARRWHVLTGASLASGLAGFLVLLVSLRALDVPASDVSTVEAFAAWALVRVLAVVPITPGGIGVVELALTSALVGFGGGNAGVVAAVLVYRFLTLVPVLVLGLVAAGTWRRHRRAGAAAGQPL